MELDSDSEVEVILELKWLLGDCGVEHRGVRLAAKRRLTDWIERNPDDLLLIASFLLSTCRAEQWGAREAAIEELGRLIGRCPKMTRTIVVAVLRAVDDVQEVKVTAKTLSKELVQKCPADAEDIVAGVLQACVDVSTFVQAAAASLLEDCIKLAPHKSQEIIDNWFRICSAEYNIWKMQEFIDAWLKTPQDILTLMLRKCEDRNSRVRTFAIHRLMTCIQACPNREQAVVTTVLAKCHDQAANVRMEALLQLRDLIEVCPSRSNEIVTKLLFACYNDRNRFRNIPYPFSYVIVMAEPTRAAKSCPERAEEILALLLRAHEWGYFEEAVAMRQLVKMAEFCPQKGDQIIAHVIRTCGHHKGGKVKASALSQLAPLAKVFPKSAERLTELLFEGCHSSSWVERWAAIEQLPNLMRACPHLAKRAFNKLLSLCVNEQEDVCRKAKDQLSEALQACPDLAQDALLALMRASDDDVDARPKTKKRGTTSARARHRTSKKA